MNLLEEDRLTVEEAAALFGVTEMTVRRWYGKGFNGVKLETLRLGARRITSRQAVERFVAAINS